MAVSPTLNPTQASWPGIMTERPISQVDPSNAAEVLQPPPLRTLSAEPLAEQTLSFLEPLRDRYTNRNYTIEERSSLAHEFQLVLLEAINLARTIYPPTVCLIFSFIVVNN